VIVLKECSSYFPGDLTLERKQQLFTGWIDEVRKRGINVVVATVVPVTKDRAAREPGKQEQIRAFNDWLRTYARANGLVLLDLEAALRADERERYLRDELTSGDGSHLNRKAYGILDGVMVQTVCAVAPSEACRSTAAKADIQR
jgi:lysophospholipase L1-like esterase